jgi:MYXO-CTERM domain-containing protein
MSSRLRSIFAVLFFLIIASCSGSGCSGCTSCAGTTPLPGGFPADYAIQNAASVRVSRPGLTFLEGAIPGLAAKAAGGTGGTLSQPIPDTSFGPNEIADPLGLDSIKLKGEICAGGPDPAATPPKCTANVNLGASTFKLDSVKPDVVQIAATVPLQLDDTPVSVHLDDDTGIIDLGITVHIAYGSNGSCQGPNLDKASVNPKALPIKVGIPIVGETVAPRVGYSKIDVENATVDLSAISGNDIQFCADCGPLTFSLPFGIGKINLCNQVLNIGFIKTFVVDQLKNQLQPQVKSLLKDQLCTAPNTALNPPCPDETEPDSGNKHCVYKAGTKKGQCLPLLLGTDAHMDLAGALASISPGTTGALDFGLAAAGAMNPAPGKDADAAGHTPNGITLGMIGGVLPKPESKCVPAGDLPQLPTGIPIPDELNPTVIDTATTPHVGIALAGRFLDYSMASVYKSGLLCLGVSTEQVDQLKAGLLSIIIPSLKNITFEGGDAAAAITTRPQAPPSVKVGGGTDIAKDPLLTITLPKFAIDFYIWSYDRFVRAFTFTADMTIPVNLQTGKDPVKNPKGGILPTIGDIGVANASVTNSDLLFDDPNLIAGSLQGLLGAFSKQLVGGGFSPIDLSSALSSLGMNLDVAQIGKLHKGTDDFVGIFANLSKTTGPATVETETEAKLLGKTVPADHMQLTTMTRAALPSLKVAVSSPQASAEHPVEYSWWIDKGTHSAWAQGSELDIQDDQLLLQGRHVLYVSARIVGEAVTEDTTPAEVPFVIDALAPTVKIDRDGDTASIDAWDVVSQKDALVARFAFDGAKQGDWALLSSVGKIDVAGHETLDVEVKDEEGNVRQISQPLIRGRADGTLAGVGSGCGCSAPGTKDAGGLLAAVLGVAGIAAIALRRRRFTLSLPRSNVRHGLMAIGVISAVAATSQGCACGSSADDTTGCGSDCNQVCKDPLGFGLPGSYTSVAKSKDGSIWVAGYNDALLSEGDSQFFGDLVVGKYDLGKQQTDWLTVDGLPARTDGTCPDRSPSSWRGGEEDSGDDVGLWTSIQVSSEDKPMVSYWDATNKQLKFAVKDDDGWKTFVLKSIPGGDAGRYSKMLIVGDKPVVAFLQFEPGAGGHTRSHVVVARGNVPTPHGPEDFSFEDAAVVEDNPCSASLCGGGQVCVKSSGICQDTVAGCTPADCGGATAGKACVTTSAKATCEAISSAVLSYPNVFGGYISLAQGGGQLGIALYDRPHGNLVGLLDKGGGKWDQFIIDGETGSRADKTAIDTGDTGVAASLQIDAAGTWHLSYVNGLDETLRYITYSGGKPGKSEIIDDGTAVDGKTHPDGQHIVGDDSTIHVDGDIVTVYYQDATVGMLRRAGGTPAGATHTWDLRALPQPNKFGGFFPALVPGEDKVANFWRQTDKTAKTVTGDVSIIQP